MRIEADKSYAYLGHVEMRFVLDVSLQPARWSIQRLELTSLAEVSNFIVLLLLNAARVTFREEGQKPTDMT
jgi:hypothetical protein